MTWAQLHRASEQAAIDAEDSYRNGNSSDAALLYTKAAELEEEALSTLPKDKSRTRGITAVSAVSLWYKAAAYDRAEQLAHHALADPSVPMFAKASLRNLVQAIWTETSKRSANVGFLPGHVFVSVKGGEIITGGAPLDLIVEKVQTIQAMFYRTVEFIRAMPIRRSRNPDRVIQESCRPWLFQAPPASYQFAVAIQEPKQLNFFQNGLRPDLVAHQFMEVVRAAANEDLQQLESVVPHRDYRDVFLKLARNLAPTGKTFGSIELRSATSETPVALTPDARAVINRSIKRTRLGTAYDGNEQEEEEIVGTLRALDLDKDFLDVVVEGKTLHVVGLGDAMDDVIGPMVNKAVRVRITKTPKGVRFRDIELDD